MSSLEMVRVLVAWQIFCSSVLKKAWLRSSVVQAISATKKLVAHFQHTVHLPQMN